MPPRRLIALLLPLAAILGCGGVSPITPTPTPVTPNLSGNWQFQIESTISPTVTFLYNFVGALSVQGSIATGTFRVNGIQPVSACLIPSTQDIPFTGSIDANDLLTLTSAPFAGSVATIQLQLPFTTNGVSNVANGTIQITGGVCALPSAFVAGILIPPIAGTYTGTLVPTPNPLASIGGPATITFTQSSANADGQFPVTANLTYTSPACTLSTTLTGIATGLNLDLNGSAIGSPFLILSGALPTNSTISPFHPILVVSNSTSTCAVSNYTGTLTHQ